MSTPRRGPAGTGGTEEKPAEKLAEKPAVDQNSVAESRAQDTAKVSADVPAGCVLLTSRTPETAPYNLVLDMDNVLVGGKTSTGFIIWYCPEKLLDRMKRHTMVVGGRVVLPPEPTPEPEFGEV